jgi:hypothetical protein
VQAAARPQAPEWLPPNQVDVAIRADDDPRSRSLASALEAPWLAVELPPSYTARQDSTGIVRHHFAANSSSICLVIRPRPQGHTEWGDWCRAELVDESGKARPSPC